MESIPYSKFLISVTKLQKKGHFMKDMSTYRIVQIPLYTYNNPANLAPKNPVESKPKPVNTNGTVFSNSVALALTKPADRSITAPINDTTRPLELPLLSNWPP